MKSKKQPKKPLGERYAQVASDANAAHLARGDAFASAQALGYSQQELASVPHEAVEMGLGCGNPTALADLREGDVVLDLGSGGGLDVFLAARRVGARGRVIGIDATPEMVEKARAFAAKGGYKNVEFRVGRMEQLPIADAAVDVIISNCVINHARDKAAVFKEAFRVLRAGGRMFISDLTLEGPPPQADSPGLEIWSDWLAAASGKQEYLRAMRAAGFQNISILAESPYSGPAVCKTLDGKIVSLHLKACK